MSDWTKAQKLAALMQLPWRVDVARAKQGYFVARVQGLPDAIATGKNDVELAQDLWESLSESLDARLEAGIDLPLPAGATVPWGPAATNARRDLRDYDVILPLVGDAWQTFSPVSTAASQFMVAGAA